MYTNYQHNWPPYDEVKKYYVSKIESEFEIQICSNERQKVLEEK